MDISGAWLGRFVLGLAVWVLLTILLPWALLSATLPISGNEFVATRLRGGATFDFFLLGIVLVISCLEIDSRKPGRRSSSWLLGGIFGFGGIAIRQAVAALFHPRGVGIYYWALTVVVGVFSAVACAIVTAANDRWPASNAEGL